MKPGYYWAQSKSRPDDPPDIILVDTDGTYTLCGNEVEFALDRVDVIYEIQPPPPPEYRIGCGLPGWTMGKEIKAG